MKKKEAKKYVMTPVTPSKHLKPVKEDKMSKLYQMVGKQFI